jgi:hypothetical protein
MSTTNISIIPSTECNLHLLLQQKSSCLAIAAVPDEPKPGDDRQSKEEIKEFGHRSTLSIERDRAMPVPLWNGGKIAWIGNGFPEES